MLLRPTLKKMFVSLIIGTMAGIVFFLLFYLLKIFEIFVSLPKVIAIGMVVAAIVYFVWSLFEEETD